MAHFIKSAFTLHKMKNLIITETIGRFFGFWIGVSSTRLLTYQVLEKKSFHNLFGILHRDQIVVHRTPHWVELLIAVIIGFVIMELFYYLVQSINTKWVWGRTLRGIVIVKSSLGIRKKKVKHEG